jgi:hypothetical protein
MLEPILFLMLGLGLILTIAISKLYMKTSYRPLNSGGKFSEKAESVCNYIQEHEALDDKISQVCFSN